MAHPYIIKQIPKIDILYFRYSRKNKLEYQEYKMSMFGICSILYFLLSACRDFPSLHCRVIMTSTQFIVLFFYTSSKTLSDVAFVESGDI